MRLLKTSLGSDGQLEWIEAWDEAIPPYAILSHTWSTTPSDEVSFRDVLDGAASKRPAYAKVAGAMNLARTEGLPYIWIDTLCIDKTSSAELSEAINSMYTYYSKARVCYVYLSDVAAAESLPTARWWTRGWTLQELLAPLHAVFYTVDWQIIGARHELQDEISSITGIQQQYLMDSSRETIWTASIAKRMSWAARRKTGRSEDMAYSLLGLFSVNMPLLYGEGGKRAFLRLQEEIMKTIDDHTIFAWIDPNGSDEPHGLLADSPLAFEHTGHYLPYTDDGVRRPYAMTNLGLRITLRLSIEVRQGRQDQERHELAALDCPPDPDTARGYLAIALKRLPNPTLDVSARQYLRINCSTLTSVGRRANPLDLYVPQVVAQVTGVPRSPDIFFRLAKRLHAKDWAPSPYNLRNVYHGEHFPGGDFDLEQFREMLHFSLLEKTIPISPKANAISAILLVKSHNGASGFIVLLGTSIDVGPTFDVKLMTDFARTEMKTAVNQFNPLKSGCWITRGSHHFSINFRGRKEPAAGRSTKMIVYDVHIQIKSNDDHDKDNQRLHTRLSKLLSPK